MKLCPKNLKLDLLEKVSKEVFHAKIWLKILFHRFADYIVLIQILEGWKWFKNDLRLFKPFRNKGWAAGRLRGHNNWLSDNVINSVICHEL